MLFDIGYGLTALGYLCLVFLMLVVRKKGLAKLLLITATLVTIGWAVLQIQSLGLLTNIRQYALIDGVRLWIWTLFLAACLQNQFSSLWALLKRPITLIILVLPTVSILTITFLPISSNLKHLALTLTTIQMLVILEQVYRQSAKQKWEYKPLVIYLASLSTFDFFTYANAAMVNQLNFAFFAARGFVFLAMLPFLVLAIRRIQHWGIDIFVSREVVTHSTLLMLSGAYLVVMALLGYLVQYFGGDWSAPIQLALFLVAIALLLSLFLSHEFRTRVKVFITKNFYANQFDYRVEWVNLTKTLAVENDNMQTVYKTALGAWMQCIKYDQGALVKTQGGDINIVASSSTQDHELNIPYQYLDDFKAFLQSKAWIIDCDEMRIKPELYEELAKRNAIIQDCNFQIILPVFNKQSLWGMVLLNAESMDKRALNWELRDYLSAITEQITSFMIQAEASKALAENAQFAAFNRMSAFVVHDLKNVLAQINLLLNNAKQHKNNPEFIDDTFETLEHTKARMDNMLKQLMDKNIEPSAGVKHTDISKLITNVITQKCANLSPLPTYHAQAPIFIDINADKLSNILYNLLSNAQQACKQDGSIDVNTEETRTNVIIDIMDDGCGMSQEFINDGLFAPFITTKGNAGMGVGAYDAKTYIESLGGSLTVKSQEGEGSWFRLTIPKIQD